MQCVWGKAKLTSVELYTAPTFIQCIVLATSIGGVHVFPPPPYSHVHIRTFTTRSLDVDTLLYIGGVESHIPLISSLSPSRFGFEGCLANFTIDDRIVDLASPVRRYGTHEGCPPRDGSCDGERLWCPGNNGECVSVWNGSLCHCEEFPECDSSQSSVSLSSGYVRLQLSHSVTVDNFTLAFRTRQTRGTLISFGSSASVKVKTREGVSEGGRGVGREGGREGEREEERVIFR